MILAGNRLFEYNLSDSFLIITRGFVYEPDAEDLLADTRRIVTETVNCTSNGRMRSDLEQSVKLTMSLIRVAPRRCLTRELEL
jgi:hypothetical protein